MSDILAKAVELLNEKLDGAEIPTSAKFAIEGLGAIVIDSDGARISDDEADVTLSADADVFQDMISGELNPTNAFMSGRLSIDGDMGAAMQLASVLS